MVVIAYDIDMTSKDGAKRLRKVADACEKYGVRVQNSVFELIVDNAKLVVVKDLILRIIDPQSDSVRFYRLGNNYANKITVLGKKPVFEQEGRLIL